MHRDKKVGLALAILLCSIVGAFFYREDSPRGGNAPELKDPQRLDAEIAQRDKPPYSEDDSSAKSRSGDTRRTNDHTKGAPPPWELPDFLRNDSDRTTAQRGKINASKQTFDQNNAKSNSSEPTTLAPPSDENTPAAPIPRRNG